LIALLLVPRTWGIWLNEIMSNPAGSEYTNEYVELLNPDSLTVEVEGWRLSDGSAEDLLQAAGANAALPPGGLALVLDPGYEGGYDDRIPPQALRLWIGDGSFGSGGLSNSTAEWITLIDPDGRRVDSVLTRPGQEEGFSLERMRGPAGCADCWRIGLDFGGSPGAANSVVPARYQLRLLDFDQSRLTIVAEGLEGFRGALRVELGLPPCLESTVRELPPLDIGALWHVELDPAPLWFLNPLVILEEGLGQEPRILCDTLASAAFDTGDGMVLKAAYLSELQPDPSEGPDWVELANPGDCPLLLEGCLLATPTRRYALNGMLMPGQRALAAADPAAVPGRDPACLSIAVNLSLTLSGELELLIEDGPVLEAAVWRREELIRGRSLERLDPRLAADASSSWHPSIHPDGATPGSSNSTEVAADPAPDGVRFSASIIRPLQPGGESLLRVDLSAGLDRAWRLEIWDLHGRLIGRAEPAPQQGEELLSLFWDGSLKGGELVPPGAYLLRLADEQGGEVLHPVAVVY